MPELICLLFTMLVAVAGVTAFVRMFQARLLRSQQRSEALQKAATEFSMAYVGRSDGYETQCLAYLPRSRLIEVVFRMSFEVTPSYVRRTERINECSMVTLNTNTSGMKSPRLRHFLDLSRNMVVFLPL